MRIMLLLILLSLLFSQEKNYKDKIKSANFPLVEVLDVPSKWFEFTEDSTLSYRYKYYGYKNGTFEVDGVIYHGIRSYFSVLQIRNNTDSRVGVKYSITSYNQFFDHEQFDITAKDVASWHQFHFDKPINDPKFKSKYIVYDN